ncbi:MAG TPA: acyl-CoA dehydrogenase family protein [Spirochaetota bacterium]|nr:acyl-CoA dehydrogenase family protein [Spirochaetota bacterium]HNT11706.1 acyl-CoA dehydrogenase family protein [Spirochaetota bacterium]
MPLFLTDEQKVLKENLRRFTESHIVPVRAELDEKEEYPAEIVKKLAAEMRLGCPFIPAEYGGAGLGIFEAALIAEELSRGCLGVSTAFTVSGLGIYPIHVGASDEMKKRFLPDIASGAKTAAFALTEAGAGSDVTAIRTTAEKKGDRYVLNGTKQWITGASKADIYTVFALTDKSKGIRGMSAFVVEKDTKGLSFGAKEKKLGIRCSETREVIMDNCEVPAENLIGRAGHAFRYAIATLDKSRPVVATSAVGLAQAAYEVAIKYSLEREQFGNPISSLQAIQHILAEMATRVETGRLLAYTACRMCDQEHPSMGKFSAMAKYQCGENAFWVANSALQIMGGYGYMRDYPIEKMLRDARILTIYEGTSQIQLNALAHELIRSAKSGKI